ncbi:MAG: 16S rRNA (uracil(1498)-N(3))-methyltransferase [Alphaproteobacteria bacterium]
MTRPADFKAQRLFVDAPLSEGQSLSPDRAQAHYLLHVLRLARGGEILLFNGRDGEWLAKVTETGRKNCILQLDRQTRPQPAPPDLWYLFAPLKQARLDYMVQKATEMGAGRLMPVLTRHTQVRKINPERMRANAIEAAEQCGILSVPEIALLQTLDEVLGNWPADRQLIFCDEAAATGNPSAALEKCTKGPAAVLIGPEGGFSETERAQLTALPYVCALSLGPRILRADTAAVAALALVQSSLGDWK